MDEALKTLSVLADVYDKISNGANETDNAAQAITKLEEHLNTIIQNLNIEKEPA